MDKYSLFNTILSSKKKIIEKLFSTFIKDLRCLQSDEISDPRFVF